MLFFLSSGNWGVCRIWFFLLARSVCDEGTHTSRCDPSGPRPTHETIRGNPAAGERGVGHGRVRLPGRGAVLATPRPGGRGEGIEPPCPAPCPATSRCFSLLNTYNPLILKNRGSPPLPPVPKTQNPFFDDLVSWLCVMVIRRPRMCPLPGASSFFVKTKCHKIQRLFSPIFFEISSLFREKAFLCPPSTGARACGHALGKEGSTKKKLAQAAACIVEFRQGPLSARQEGGGDAG